MRPFFRLVLAVACLLPCRVFSQKVNESYQYDIRRVEGEIVIDGSEEDAAWQKAQVATNFHQVQPMDTSRSTAVTEVRMSFDDQNLYIIAVCRRPTDANYSVASLRRDFSFNLNDNFIFFLDPFDDQTNGFTFGANAAGAQWDGQQANGGGANLSWDNKWRSEVQQYPDRWVFEGAIPFKTLRFKQGLRRWGVNFSRLELSLNEKSAWAPVPRMFPTATLAYTGVLNWVDAPPNPGTNISIIPYVQVNTAQNRTKSPVENSFGYGVGGDAKVALTSSLNLDLTVNPDFSQVEVDQQVTNLSRFELFFPERRQFFLENSDLFDSFGFANTRPFFSRRIGLNSPIYYGARMSGKLNKNWRTGVLNMQTGAVDSLGIPSRNFLVAAVQRQVFARSNVAAMLVNRASMPGDAAQPGEKTEFHRNLALEYNLLTSNNRWAGKAAVHRSFSPDPNEQGWMQLGFLSYETRTLRMEWRHEYVGENFRAETGFVPRTGFFRINPEVGYTLFPKKASNIVSHNFQAETSHFFDQKGKHIESESFALYTLNFQDRSALNTWTSYDYVYLQAPFDPTNTGGDTLARGTDYTWNAFGLEYVSSPKYLFTWSAASRYGGYFGGTRLNLRGSIGYRFQPYVNLAMDVSYNDIQLQEPLKDARLWLISPRLDVTFTNTLFLTTFLQYNNQADNVNLNVRFQWRYQPASDIFVVYTDNYFPDNLMSKSRAFVLKWTYWFNV